MKNIFKALTISVFILIMVFQSYAQRKRVATGKPGAETLKLEIEKIMRNGSLPDKAMLERLKKEYPVQHISTNTEKVGRGTAKTNVTQVSKASFTGKKLTEYVDKLLDRLEKKMDPEVVDIVNNIEKRTDTNSNIMSQLSYYLYLMESEDAALLLGGRTVLKDPLNDLSTNNFGAMLTSCGAAPQAIPILRGLVPHYKKNAMVLNNMGQAFASVGMGDSAMYYFAQCLMLEPKHAMANKTAANLTAEKGNKTEAVEYAKNSIEGGMTIEALELLDQLDPSSEKFDFLAHKKNIPDYFNIYKFKKPTLQRKHGQTEIVRAEQLAFMTEIDRMIENLSVSIQEEEQRSLAQTRETVKRAQEEAMRYGKINKMLFSPINQIATKVYTNRYINTAIPQEMQKIEEQYRSEIAYRKQTYENDILNITTQYVEKKSPYDCGEGKGNDCKILEQLTLEECKVKNARLDVFLEACATAAERYDQRQLQLARERFFFNSKWGYLLGTDPHMANAQYYHAAKDYLINIRKVVGFKPEDPFCLQLEKMLETYRFEDLVKPYCPINSQLDFGAISLKINCKESIISLKLDHFIKAAEFGKLSKKVAFWLDGVKLQLKSDHIKKSNTISVIKSWLDESIEVPSMLTPIRWKAGAKVEVSTTAYITFDGKGQIGDAGLKGAAMTSAWSGVDSEVAGSLSQVEAGVELGWGFNSGSYVTPKGMLAELWSGLGM
ncbi:M48 family metallopeptidase [Sphingobacterium sp. 18053]|uniref:tetratricopeptide repeat protein n=1 Tax=Sphingobacterium sp. 18053 TaxID=2681401 RepID=UPI00135ACEBA|nr:hypothetical protein [Sphingobacterium sp. 18053]